MNKKSNKMKDGLLLVKEMMMGLVLLMTSHKREKITKVVKKKMGLARLILLKALKIFLKQQKLWHLTRLVLLKNRTIKQPKQNLKTRIRVKKYSKKLKRFRTWDLAILMRQIAASPKMKGKMMISTAQVKVLLMEN